jgi:Tfp pilus assembly major pilin PilA
MALFGKKSDVISARSKALNREIADLEAKIKKLSAQPAPAPKPRETQPAKLQQSKSASIEPVFETLPSKPRSTTSARTEDAAHFNEMGVRKYDLVSLLARIRGQFQKPPTHNPKLIQLIAAGNIHGLRPLRYEKRVARNRFIFVAAVLALVVWGIVAMIR